MLRNYIKVAWRNLVKNKIQSLITLAGLSIGVASSLLILLWVQNELSVDTFHKNKARLYKIYEREYYQNGVDGNYDTPAPLAEELKKVLPEVEDAVAMQEENHEATLNAGDKIIKAEGTAAGAGLFSMFSYPLSQGNPSTALASLNSIAISVKTAKQFFGTAENAMGKSIRFDNERNFMVSAVFTDLPENVSRRFDYVISWRAWQQDNPWSENWGNTGPVTFVLLREDADPVSVDKKLNRFLDLYNKDQSDAYRIELGLQKFDETYLHARFKDGVVAGGRIEYVRLFGIVALFILLIACINFMNLSTARSINRAREVGVRKAAGALRSALIQQFLCESFLLTFLAVGVAVLLVALALPVFNSVTQKRMVLPFRDAYFWLEIVAVIALTGLVSGSYPAWLLSSFKPVNILKGKAGFGTGVAWFRKGLVVFQFMLSMILITGTIVVSRQVSFIQDRNLGYDRENLIYIPVEGELAGKYALFKSEALKMPGIKGVSRVSDNPTNFDSQTNNADWEGRDSRIMISFEHPIAGYDFDQVMKLKMLQGRYFSKNFPTDTAGYILNETAAKKTGYVNPVGRSFTLNGRKAPIIGVLKDFHFRSLHEQINPVVMEFGEHYSYGNLLIRTQPGKTKEALFSLKKLCAKLNPQFSFSYTFSDEAFKRLYQNEQVVSKLSYGFASLAILISCLGLLGLVIFTAEQRTKEIGIRKVLGASVAGIVQLMSADLLKLVCLAAIMAVPVSWLVMHRWLNNYTYKVSISWWMFAVASCIAILIAFFTISFQAIKAALANPVKSLRNE